MLFCCRWPLRELLLRFQGLSEVCSTAFDFSVILPLRNADDTKVHLPMSGPDRLHCLTSPDFILSWLYITPWSALHIPSQSLSHHTAGHSKVTDASHQAWDPTESTLTLLQRESFLTQGTGYHAPLLSRPCLSMPVFLWHPSP